MVGIKGLTNLIWVWDVQDLDFNWAPYNPGDSHWDVLAMDMYGGDGYTTQKYQTILQLTGISGNAVQQIQDLYNAANVITLDQMPGWS